jgi:hypothetical protein
MSKPQMNDAEMLEMHNKLLAQTTNALETETDPEKIKTLKLALDKLNEVITILRGLRTSSGGSKTKKGGNKKRRKTRNNRK